jgi:hypothetical protein
MGRQSICSHVTSAQATLTSSLHDTNFCHTPQASASSRNVRTSLLSGRPQGWRSQIRLHKMIEKRAELAEGYSRDHLWWIRLRRMTRISDEYLPCSPSNLPNRITIHDHDEGVPYTSLQDDREARRVNRTVLFATSYGKDVTRTFRNNTRPTN